MAKFVRIMGDDPGDTADVTSGRLNTDTEFTGTITVGEVRGMAADGAAVSGNPVLIAGFDGTNVQTLLEDTSGRPIVVGAAADGAAVSGNPVLMAGSDTTNAQTLAVDTTGRQLVVGSAADGAAVSGSPLLMAGQDGTNAQSLLTDTSGRQIVIGSVADGSAVSGFPVLIAGQDGTNAQSALTDSSGRFDVTSTVSGGMPVDTELPAAAALADATATPTTPVIGTMNHIFNGTTWDFLREGNVAGSIFTDVTDRAARLVGQVEGRAADGGAVAGNPVLVGGYDGTNAQTLITDTTGNIVVVARNADVALADAQGNTAPTWGDINGSSIRAINFEFIFNGTSWDRVRSASGDALAATGILASGNMIFNGTTWDRAREGNDAGSVLVDMSDDAARDLGLVTVDGTVDITELPAAAVLADATANPSLTQIGSFGLIFNGTTWDRMRGSTTGTQLIGGIAHDAANTAANNPFVGGFEAIAHGTNPTAVAAADVTRWYANRAGVPFVIGGHPNIVTTEYLATTAQTDDAIVTVGAGNKIVVTEIDATTDNATTVDVGVRVGFGATIVPALPADGAAVAGVVLSHAGIPPGSGMMRGDGSGILGVGADNEDLRITNEVPTSGALRVTVSYYTIES